MAVQSKVFNHPLRTHDAQPSVTKARLGRLSCCGNSSSIHLLKQAPSELAPVPPAPAAPLSALRFRASPPPPPPPPRARKALGDDDAIFFPCSQPVMLTITPPRSLLPPVVANCPCRTGVRFARPSPMADSEDRRELCVVEGVLMPRRTELRPAAAAAVETETVAGFSLRSSASSTWACARSLWAGAAGRGEGSKYNRMRGMKGLRVVGACYATSWQD